MVVHKESSVSARGAAVEHVGTADFAEKVLRRSKSVPVVVDFWASWCGPCRMLGPVLERLAQEAHGEWLLVKVNTDEHPSLAQQWGIQGIPAVKAFRNGRVVAEFVGYQPESAVREFLKGLLPSVADRLAQAARDRELAGDLEAAEAGYRRALAEQSDHPAAMLGLGRVLFQTEHYEAAAKLLEAVPQRSPERAEAEMWLAQARFRRDSSLTGGEVDARRRLSANPTDVAARLALATALAARGAYREALEGLLVVIQGEDRAAADQARSAMVDVFRVLGDDHELTQQYRALLAASLW